MEKVKTYIQQLDFNGISYSKGKMSDLLTDFGIIIQNFPFKVLPEAKELPKRDWAGEHGVDVYVPKVMPVKDYKLEIECLYVGKDDYKAGLGDERLIRKDITDFIEFIYGHSKAPGQDANNNVQSGRLAIYNEHTKNGRKDVTVSKVDPDLFLCDSTDDECIARFKVTFNINDPVTKVQPVETSGVTNLSWT